MSSGHPESFPRLLCDVGGTNARFAIQHEPGGPFSEPRTLTCAEHASLRDAILHYLAQAGPPRPRWCAIGIANPVVGDAVRMTNHHWSFSIVELQRELQLERLVVLNDFTALALALPALRNADLRQVGGGTERPGAPKALLGPGTGLGMSGLVPTGTGDYAPLRGEGGHITLAAGDERDARIIAWLRGRYEHVSAERALSGRGLVDLYHACSELRDRPAQPLDAAQITTRGADGSDPACAEALDIFCGMLGTVAGDLALIVGALGGVYVGGGIVPRLGEYFARSPFRARFERKGRFASYLAQIPTYVISASFPALLGAAQALDRAARDNA
jgi:glucokinase